MGLLNKIFGGKETQANSSPPASSLFHESEATTEQAGSKNAPRRELVHVVLRDTMRKHGIPSDWMDCRVLTMVSRRNVTGIHVTFIVRQGHDNLLAYVYPFQDSFRAELAKYEPRYEDWLMSVSWQFDGTGAAPPGGQGGWGVGAPVAAAAAVAAHEEEDDVEADLKALYAIRDAALKGDSADEPIDFQPTRPGFEDSGKR
jgi:hypothetical protein